jgi:pimeloyl-ACP methyl ester carboxylesterase
VSDYIARRFYRLRRFERGLISSLARRWKIFSPLLQAQAPVRLKHYGAGNRSQELLIFLPGIGDVLEDYEARGFIDAVQRSGVPIDITVADVHFGYYVARTAIERLHQDIVLPARASGYSRISLAGISLGGFGALYYAMNHSNDVARLFLLAPYLGDDSVIGEISRAGGIRVWEPNNIGEHDEQRKLWRWLKLGAHAHDTSRFENFYLAYGLQDKLAPSNELLAELLPATNVYTVCGKHDWITWSSLWNMLLAQSKNIFSSG